MNKPDYIAMAKKVQLHDKLEQFTMDDLERILAVSYTHLTLPTTPYV